MHHQKSSSVWPRHAKTGMPTAAKAAATSFCVEKMLHADQRTFKTVERRPIRKFLWTCVAFCTSLAFHLCSKSDEGLDHDSCLRIDVGAADDVGAAQRMVVGRLLAQGHDPGHLLLGQLDLTATESTAMQSRRGTFCFVGNSKHIQSKVRRPIRKFLHLTLRFQGANGETRLLSLALP